MSRSLVAVLVAMLAAPVFAADPPVVTSVTPNAGPAAGGTAVEIRGSGLGLPPNFSCVAPCPAKVTFGDIEVAVSHESDDRLVVTSPKHAPGTVSLIVRTGDGRTTTVNNGFTYLHDAESGWEKVLLPVYTDGQVPGQGGSLWQTELWFRNNGTNPLSVAPWTCEAQVCPPVIPLTRGVPPGESFRNLPAFFRPPTNNPGRMLYVTRDANYSVNVRFSDLSRQTLNAGTEMPSIRESELLTSTANLLNVPVDTNSRLLLRIYDVDNKEARFRVRVWPQSGTPDKPWVDAEVTARTNEDGTFRISPAYAEHTGFLDPAAIVTLPVAVRVEVTPLTPGRFWTFVSITNNNTQLVSLVTPQ